MEGMRRSGLVYRLSLLLVLAIASAASSKITRKPLGAECIASIEYALDGFIAWPGSQAYNDSIAIDNGSIKRNPVAVIFPFTPEDVSIALLGNALSNSSKSTLTQRIATQKCGLGFTAKNGGHSAGKYHDESFTYD